MKSNIGHSESAAGVAGLLKVILMMKNGLYVPSLHVISDKSNLNPKIRLTEFGLEISSHVKEWHYNVAMERHACLNSFGFGGSNTHVIISQKLTAACNETLKNIKSQFIPICLSGINQESLRLNLLQFHDDIETSDCLPHDIAHTSFNYRDIFPYRTIVFGQDAQCVQKECKNRLKRIESISPEQSHKKVFVYCGVGTTWTGMCRELMKESDVFRSTIEKIDRYLEPLVDFKIREKFANDTNYDDPLLNHIAIFCSQVALTEVWKSFGIEPDAVIGQSVGEVAAAYAAKILTLEESIQLIYQRSKILSGQCQGSMVVIGNMSIKKVENLISKYGNDVCIAVYSSPVACTLSGNTSYLNLLAERLHDDLEKGKVFVRQLSVKCAYHSPLLDCSGEIKAKVGLLFCDKNAETKHKLTVPIISTVTGRPIASDEMRSGSYWASNVCDPVLFMQSIKQIYDPGNFNIFLEIGPRPVLKPHITNIIENTGSVRVIPSLLANVELPCLYSSLSELFELGVDIDISQTIPFKESVVSQIPRYRFNRTGDLFLPTSTQEYLGGFSKPGDSGHMFVQSSKHCDEMKFILSIDDKSTPFVYDHFFFDDIIIPGATYVEAGFHVGREMLKKPVDQLSVGFTFRKTFSPLIGRRHTLDVQLTSRCNESLQFNIRGDSNVLAVGTISERKTPMRESIDISYLKAECPICLSKIDCYEALKSFQFQYGTNLSLIQNAWISESRSKCLTEIKVTDNVSDSLLRTHFHPAVIDSVFQIFGILSRSTLSDEKFAIPKGVDVVVVNRSIQNIMYGYAEKVKNTENSTFYNAVLLSEDGNVIAEMRNFYTKSTEANVSQTDKSNEYSLEWSETFDFADKRRLLPGRVVLCTNVIGTELERKLERAVDITCFTDIENVTKGKNIFDTDTVLVYHVAEFGELMKNTAEAQILDCAVKRFFDVKKLLTFLADLRVKVPFIIITENTQACPGRHFVQCNGSELWGMLRSAAHEGFNKNIKIVDIDTHILDVTVLVNLLFCKSQCGTEFALCGSNIFRAGIQSMQRNRSSKRPIVMGNFEKMTINSKSSTEISKPYLLLSRQTELEADAEQVTLKSFSKHDKSLYLPTLEDEDTSDLVLQKDTRESRIIVLEGRGTIEKTGEDIYFLYPVNASTIVHIPREHIVYQTDYPEYTSGIMILANLLSQVVFEISEGANVMVITSSDEIDIGKKILTLLLSKKHCKTKFCCTDELSRSKSAVVEMVLIATCLSKTDWKSLITCYEWSHIISPCFHIKENVKRWLMYKYPHMNLTVLSTTEVFRAKRIKRAMHLIKECLRHFQYKNSKQETSKFFVNLPVEEIKIEKGIEDGSLTCYCNFENMFRWNGCYIIVGGLTGLGWELLQLMAEMGAGILITLSRRKPSHERQHEIQILQKKNSCQIKCMQVDVSDFKSVKRGFEDVQNTFPKNPIRGIFHGGGIILDSVLEKLDEKSVTSVMRPKIQGAWNLHLVSLNIPLDFFVMHSSIVSVIGNPAQCNYSAANSFLDTLAVYRRSKGLPAQSINWGPLSMGMAIENGDIQSKLNKKGFNYIGREQVRKYFKDALINDFTNVIYADIEWDKLLLVPTFSLQSLKYTDLHTSKKVSSNVNRFQKVDLATLHQLKHTDRIGLVRNVLKAILKEVLVTEDDCFIDKRSLAELGIDSMAAMSLSNAIDEMFNCRMSVVILLSDETNLSTLVEHVLKNNQLNTNPSPNHETTPKPARNNSDHLLQLGSEKITFMQKDLLSNYLKNRDDPYYLRVIDVEIFGLKLREHEWKTILTHVLKLRPELCRKYIFQDSGTISVECISAEDIESDVEMVPFKEIEHNEISDARMAYHPDINKVLPIFFKTANTERSTIVRIVTHALVIDMKGISLFCKDMENTLVAFLLDQTLPEKYASVDVFAAIKRSLIPKMKELETFWKNCMNYDIKPVTLGENFQTVDVNYCCVYDFQIPKQTVVEIKQYAARKGISIYEFMMSLYQLYLYIGSKTSIVAVGTAADMRFHVPELKNVLTRCANYVPVIAHINPKQSVADFIQTNSFQISSTTKNGGYPSSLILKKIKSPEARRHIFRHFLTVNDFTAINKLTKDRIRAEIRRLWHVRPDRETFIYVSYNLPAAWMKLEIGHNSKICGNFGKTLPENLMYLADQAMNFGNRTIEHIRDELLSSHVHFEKDIETIEREASAMKSSHIWHSSLTRSTGQTEEKKLQKDSICDGYRYSE